MLLQNLTFQNCDNAGIYIYEGSNGSTTVDNCVISNCGSDFGDPYSHNSGLVCLGNLTVKNSKFMSNYNHWWNYSDRDYSIGGAIYVNYTNATIEDGYVNIINNEFIDNKAADCGAIFATTNQTIIVENNYFEGNGVLESVSDPELHPYWCPIARFEDSNNVEFIGNICWENLSFDYANLPPQDQNGLVFKDCENTQIIGNTISQNLNEYVDYGIHHQQ